MLTGTSTTAAEGVRHGSLPQAQEEELPVHVTMVSVPASSHASRGPRSVVSDDVDQESLYIQIPPPPASMAAAPIPSVVGTPVSSRSAVGSRNQSFTSAPSGALRSRHGARSGKSNPISGVVDGEGGGGEVSSPPGSPNEAVEASEPKVDSKPAIIGYFGYMFGVAACGAFYSTIFTEHGFGPAFVGTMMAIIPIFSLFLLPLLSFIADKFRCPKQMLAVCSVIATVSLSIFTTASTEWVIVVGFILHVASQCPMNPLLDQQTLSIFPRKHRTERWGFVRAFGAYGWGLGNPVASLIADYGGWGYTPLQYVIGQVGLLYCVWAAKPYEVVQKVPVKVKDIVHVLRENPRLLLFLVASAMMGMGYSFINAFLFIFLRELNASRFLLGLTVLVTVSTEIPIFQCSKYLHRWFTDRHMMTLAMCIWAVRVFGYSLLSNPWYVMLLEPLHGVTFGLMWLPGVHMINVAFPPQLASSATGVLFTFSSGIGPLIGNIVGGFVYAAKGGAWAFRFLSIFMICAMICYQLLDRFLEKKGHLLGGHEHDEVVVVDPTEDAAAATADVDKGRGVQPATDVVVTNDREK